MKVLVIGYGSIGQRHVQILREMDLDVSVVSRRDLKEVNFYNNLQIALQENDFDYIVIANETVEHLITLKMILDNQFTGKILVEKPLFVNMEFVEFDYSKTYVAYNLRFHPLIQKLKKMLKNEQVISVNSYVGQYLPSWRPNSDYTKGYSAFSEQGGGVLRDLSHELDYLTILFGEWHILIAKTDKISNLNIQSEDYVHISYKTKQQVHIAVELNYLDRITQRYVIVQTNEKTIKIDFINNSINCNGEIEQLDKLDRDYTYRKQHDAVLSGSSKCCSFSEGLNIVNMIEAVEKSSRCKEWVYND
ncbi:Gfo/Idh/MocA family protein [Lysinibacillus sphaericus]|uniref:Gfo/Idh/MocA family protein n=1 Tax=Lysinibacillus sphaericus TaxID=1421 RepID=UPI000C19FA6C|nr:Gfo/Idh/MocA family oxidoreductase [Lysinibacillus sphaericus]PIJ99400.1 oxidoreductase [Lysinibacillus sphaericus]